MFELAEIVLDALSEEIPETYWIQNKIDSDLKDVSVVFNISLTDTRGTFDQAVIVQYFTLDVYLNVPEVEIAELKDKSIYVRDAIRGLVSNEHIKYVRFVGEEIEKLEDTNTFSNRLTFEVQYVQ